jgi:hypothetical protein
MNKILTTITVTLFLANTSFAWYDHGKSAVKPNSNGNTNSLQTKAANCSPAIATKFLEYNNVSALIETGGSMWQDRNNTRAAYEVPKGSDEYLMFSGALWMGGKDVNNQLKVAALTFRSGNDFWTGPLSVIAGTGDLSQGTKDYGSAEIEPDVCNEYDKFFDITRAEVDEFVSWYQCGLDPDCNTSEDFPNYSVPTSITNWPAHGDVSRFQDFYLAPFKDVNGDQVYNPQDGDYPWYDLNNEVDCRSSRQVTLYGDFTRWWIFNDKGNVHTETQGDAIGMEIRAQAFAFATNDEINNMTFFNYELVNRSTQRLKDTYFAVWADPDIGCSDDDFVGCDVQRGVGYAYNGTNTDVGSTDPCNFPIGDNPPAIGIDFFEGPYQDNDGIDNPLTSDIPTALAMGGIPYSGLGIGYGDGTPDNERLGMKRFVYFSRGAAASQSDPDEYTDYYNYMTGIWKDNEPFVYGGSGYPGSPGSTSIPTNYLFPGDSDPLNWGTSGVPGNIAGGWSESNNGGTPNNPNDRRWVQAAGPFILEPGALNNITVGVVYGKTNTGIAFNSVELMLKADDKAQALFDNCFRILNGPNAPDLTAQELDQEAILYVTNRQGQGSGSNYDSIPEDYEELDPIILALGDTTYDPYYRFQGYQIYQLKNAEVGPDELNITSSARLVAQCDKKDGIGQMINFPIDPDLGYPIATEMVDGADEGIKHSFRITQDAFAQGTNKNLINHKKYYYMAIAYAHNYYKEFQFGGDGQQYPYLAGRKSATGAISYITVIPHIPTPELGGTVQLADYGYGPKITREEGRGSGGDNILFLTEESEEDIVANYTPQSVTYENAAGPINVKVVDPLNVLAGTYRLAFSDYDVSNCKTQDLDTLDWYCVRTNGSDVDTIFSEKSISTGNEQLIPEWGISISIEQYFPSNYQGKETTELLYHELTYADSSKRWLTGVPNVDGTTAQNWIESGTSSDTSSFNGCGVPDNFKDNPGIDDEEVFEGVIGGTWAPMTLVRDMDCFHMPLPSGWSSKRGQNATLHSHSVDIVFTSDKSKWTRVPVLETQDDANLSWDGNTDKLEVKKLPSKDKDGNSAAAGSGNSTNPNDPNYISEVGMSWFPGYAIDVSSGERLNMAFGEDSWLGNENGKDMLWNPTGNMYTNFGEVLFGGKHYVYIFKNYRKVQTSQSNFDDNMPAYDNGQFLYEKLISGTSVSTPDYLKVWRACSWIGTPMLSETAISGTSDDPYAFIETDARIQIRVADRYERHSKNDSWYGDCGTLSQSRNDWYNLYSFDMEEIATVTADESALDSACQLINVVPNPYYAYSNYEYNRLENVVKIVNLPDICTIRIYNTSGTLVRTFTKDSPVTSVDWDLANHAGIPIASGMYIIHVEVPGGCERVLKWLGVVRPPDLENF